MLIVFYVLMFSLIGGVHSNHRSASVKGKCTASPPLTLSSSMIVLPLRQSGISLLLKQLIHNSDVSPSGSVRQGFSAVSGCCSSRCNSRSFQRVPPGSRSAYHSSVPVSGSPRNLPSDRYRCTWQLWTCFASFLHPSVSCGTCGWCTGIRDHYYTEFGITVIMPKKKLCRSFSSSMQFDAICCFSSA